ncbi:unnamed protein product [Knipowitschia caucasica]
MSDNNPSQTKKLWRLRKKWRRKRRTPNDAHQQNNSTSQHEPVFTALKTTTFTVTFRSSPGPEQSPSSSASEHSRVNNNNIPPPQSQPAAVSASSASKAGESRTDSSSAPAAVAGPSSAQSRGQRPCSSFSAVVPSKCLAIDCEMVGAGPKGHISQLARCSIVSYDGDVIYDKFVLPPLPVTDYRTPWSGIRKSDLTRATPYELARKEILKLLMGKVLVGHAIHNDLKALNHSHPKALIRDTSRIPLLNTKAGFGEREMVSLKRLTKAIFNRDIQTGRKGHSSVEDAKATMDLYRVVAAELEQKMASERK